MKTFIYKELRVMADVRFRITALGLPEDTQKAVLAVIEDDIYLNSYISVVDLIRLVQDLDLWIDSGVSSELKVNADEQLNGFLEQYPITQNYTVVGGYEGFTC